MCNRVRKRDQRRRTHGADTRFHVRWGHPGCRQPVGYRRCRYSGADEALLPGHGKRGYAASGGVAAGTDPDVEAEALGRCILLGWVSNARRMEVKYAAGARFALL